MVDSDHRDMAALCGGEDAALDRIMARWGPRIETFVFRHVQNREDASDLVQETFVRVYQHRHKYRPKGKFSTWLFAIAVNLCRNRARWRKRHPTVSLDGPPERSFSEELWKSDTVSPAAALDRADSARLVREAVAGLPHELRTVVILSQYEGLRHEEIAGIVNVTTKAVETRLYRARRKIKKHLEGTLLAAR